jgi:tight adherence protein C
VVLGPNSYIARRKGKLVEGYRVAFPLGLIVICVDAGLILEAALDRISGEISRQNNLMLMGVGGEIGRDRSRK